MPQQEQTISEKKLRIVKNAVRQLFQTVAYHTRAIKRVLPGFLWFALVLMRGASVAALINP